MHPSQLAPPGSMAAVQSYSPAAVPLTISGLVTRRLREPAGLGRFGQSTPYAAQQEAIQASGMPWYPVQSESEWRYLKFLFRSGLLKRWINEALDLKMVSSQFE